MRWLSSLLFLALPSVAFVASSSVGYSDSSAISFWSHFRGWPVPDIYALVLALVTLLPLSRKIRMGFFEKEVYRRGFARAVWSELVHAVLRGCLVSLGSMVLFFGTYFALGTFTHLVSPGVGLSLNTSNFIVICGYASSPTNASALLPLMSLTAQMLFHCVLWISLGGLIAIASAGSLVSLAIPYFVVSSAGPLLRLSDGFSASFFTNNCYQSDPQQQTIFQSLAVYYTLEAVALVAAAIYLRSIYLTGKLRLR